MNIDQKQRLDRVLGGCLLLVFGPPARVIGKVLRRDHSTEPKGEIVFIKIVGGGNLLLSLPSLLGLRARYPDRPLGLVCGHGVRPFAEVLGLFDRIDVVEDRKGLASLLLSSARTLASLLRRRIDTVVDFEVYSVLTTVFSLLTCARNRIGFYLESTYWRRNILTHLVFFNRSGGVYRFYEAAVRLLGADPLEPEACREHLVRRLGGPAQGVDGPFLAVGAGCSDFGSVRLLPLEEWQAFALVRRADLASIRWVFLGAEADREVSEAVARALAKTIGPETFCYTNLCGTLTLRESLAVLMRAQRFVGVDSALLHAARLFRVSATSFWGPTDPRTRLQPVAGLEEVVHYRPLLCSPCLHVAAVPPCKGENLCMRLFTSDEVPLAQWCEDASGASVRPPGGSSR